MALSHRGHSYLATATWPLSPGRKKSELDLHLHSQPSIHWPITVTSSTLIRVAILSASQSSRRAHVPPRSYSPQRTILSDFLPKMPSRTLPISHTTNSTPYMYFACYFRSCQSNYHISSADNVPPDSAIATTAKTVPRSRRRPSAHSQEPWNCVLVLHISSSSSSSYYYYYIINYILLIIRILLL